MRIASTQVVVTAKVETTDGRIISIRQSTEAESKLADIYSLLNINSKPLGKRKSMLHPNRTSKKRKLEIKELHDGLLQCGLGCLRFGNGVYRFIDSSIIIGEHQALGLCVHTGVTFGKLFHRIRKCWERDEAVVLIVEQMYR